MLLHRSQAGNKKSQTYFKEQICQKPKYRKPHNRDYFLFKEVYVQKRLINLRRKIYFLEVLTLVECITFELNFKNINTFQYVRVYDTIITSYLNNPIDTSNNLVFRITLSVIQNYSYV